MAEKRSVWWKIYFYIIVFLNILILSLFLVPEINDEIMYFYYYKSDLIYDLFLMILFIIALIGFYGFLYNKSIFNREFWILVLLMHITGDFGFLLSLDTRDESQLYWAIASIIASIPIYIGLYYYTFKMKLLWEKNK